MAAVWRRAWRSKKVSSAGHGDGDGDGDGALPPIFGSSSRTTTTSGTRTTSDYTTSSEPIREDEKEESAMELRQEEVVKTRRRMRGLVEEFRAGADGNNATAPDRWLSELHVAWLLRPAEPDLAVDTSGQRVVVSRQMQSWILALQVIRTSVRTCLGQLCSDDDETTTTVVGSPAAVSEFVQFLKATLLKMFTFVDAIVALDPLSVDVDGASATSQQHVSSTSSSAVVLVGVAEKIRALLDVHHALSAASEQILMAFFSSLYVQSDDIEGLFSAQLGKLDQAVLDTFDHFWTAVTPSLDDDDNDSSAPAGTRGATTQTTLLQLQPSPDIHKVTRSVINYLNIVVSSEPLLLTANYEHDNLHSCSLTTLVLGVLRYLEEEIVRVSQSFPDLSLRLIFLINNYNFIIQQHLDTSWPPQFLDFMFRNYFSKNADAIHRYIQRYIQVTWAPVLKCLNNPKFNCFTRSSPLQKFQSMFQTTYATQKLWKVPDPELRKRLRQAIIKEVVVGFRRYLEDNNRITPGVTPQEVEEMLEELFEG